MVIAVFVSVDIAVIVARTVSTAVDMAGTVTVV